MSDVSAIEWTDATWNPVTGCTRVSPGCANCYIVRTPPFRMGGRVFARVGNEETTGVQLHPDRLEKPLTWRKPRRVFVCSLADLFHEDVPDEYLAEVYGVMAAASDHTFQVLTKRPERMRAFLGDSPPLPNVWLGVSIENARYTWRADVLREIPAAVRFISAEPLLGSLLTDRHIEHCRYCGGYGWTSDPATYRDGEDNRVPCEACHGDGQERREGYAALDLTGIDWLIAGGESGPGARPMHPDWARELRDACVDQRGYAVAVGNGPRPPYPGETAFFFKQWGEWVTEDQSPEDAVLPGEASLPWGIDGDSVYRLGKKKAGRELDGREWNEYPEART